MQKSNGLFVAYMALNSARLTGSVPLCKPHSTLASWQEIRASIGAMARLRTISWTFNRIQRFNEFFAGYLARKSARLTASAPLSLPHSILDSINSYLVGFAAAAG